MSTEAEKTIEEVAPELPKSEPPVDELTPAPVVEQQSNEPVPSADGEAAPEAPAEEKTEKKEEKVVEPPKDIREDPLGWLGQQIPPAVHKVNYIVLDWMQKQAIEEEDKRPALPGKNESVTKNQFINYLKDGQLLASLANKLSPGAIETVHEGEALKEKDNQKANVEAFTNWAKTTLGLEEDKVMTATDLLEKGKAGYPAVVGTLWQLAGQAKEKFDKEGIDVDAVVTAAGQAVKTTFLQHIFGFFKRARPTTGQSAKQAALEAEEKERVEKEKAAKEEQPVNEPEAEVVEEECVKQSTEQSAPAVAAN